MQLPRGRFRALKKGVTIRELLNEMKANEFTGFCNITGGSSPLTLVTKKGRVLLAIFGDLAGEPASRAILSILSEEVDAELSDLTDAQIQLSIEFNPAAVVPAGDIRLPRESGKSQQSEKSVQEKKIKIPEPSESAAEVRSDTDTPKIKPEDLSPSGDSSARREMDYQQSVETTVLDHAGGDMTEEEELVYEDLKVLDEMDLDSMSEKIRANCKIMVKKLNLEHLLERKDTIRNERE